ncbi:MAG: rhodanese-like domain-containing protein [Chloroflexi bacterium]|nr:rhodanese-like domain-containing protein [Chloroflexota bacterium]
MHSAPRKEVLAAVANRVDAQEPFKRVSIDEAKRLIASGIQIVDVRTLAEYAAGHLPEARLVPLDSIIARPRDLLKGSNILFVCAVGQRSALAAEMAAAIGLTDLFNLEGGTDAWARAGEPIVR